MYTVGFICSKELHVFEVNDHVFEVNDNMRINSSEVCCELGYF